MTPKLLIACMFAAVAAAAATAQSDRVRLLNGTAIEGVEVTDYDIRSLRYKKRGSTESVQSDQVAKVELGDFRNVYARGLRDADLMLTLAREQLEANNTVLAQLGFVGAAARFFDSDRAPEAVNTLNELEKAIPEAGVLPEVYRQKFEYYMGLGSKGASNALAVAKKYESDAIGGAWPNGFAIEASFFQALSEEANAAEFQNKLRGIVSRARGNNPLVANRANVELAHSLRKSATTQGAQRIYEALATKDGVDDSSRAGAFLGLGMMRLDAGSENDKQKYKDALLYFLRVRLETDDCWPSLQAEALYHAVLAASKWQGPEYRYIMGRCRSVLLTDFKNSEWAERIRQMR